MSLIMCNLSYQFSSYWTMVLYQGSGPGRAHDFHEQLHAALKPQRHVVHLCCGLCYVHSSTD